MAPRTGRRLWLAGTGVVALAAGALLVLRWGPPKTDADARRTLAARRPAPADINIVVPCHKMVQVEDFHLIINHMIADELKRLVQQRQELQG